jgi:hypothetical protein
VRTRIVHVDRPTFQRLPTSPWPHIPNPIGHNGIISGQTKGPIVGLRWNCWHYGVPLCTRIGDLKYKLHETAVKIDLKFSKYHRPEGSQTRYTRSTVKPRKLNLTFGAGADRSALNSVCALSTGDCQAWQIHLWISLTSRIIVGGGPGVATTEVKERALQTRLKLNTRLLR